MRIHLIVARDGNELFVADAHDGPSLIASAGSRMVREQQLQQPFHREVFIEVPDGTLELAFPAPVVVQGEVGQ